MQTARERLADWRVCCAGHGMEPSHLAAAAATRASCALRVQVAFWGSSTAWPPAASIFCLALALNAAALMVSLEVSSPVPSTCCGSADRAASRET